MNKTKRLLALTICLLMTITSLPVTQLVFAGENAEEIYKKNFEKGKTED